MHLRRHIERTLRIKREATTVNDDVKRKLTITLAALLAIGAGGYFYGSQDTRSSNHRFATGPRQPNTLDGNAEDPGAGLTAAHRPAEVLREPFPLGIRRAQLQSAVGYDLGSGWLMDQQQICQQDCQ